MEKNENAYFDSIMVGLNEALEVSKGNLTVRRRKVTISPVPEYKADKIKEIREALNLSQIIFAEAVGVSVKTIEAGRISIESIGLSYTPRTDIVNKLSGMYYKEWEGPFSSDEERYREITKKNSSTSEGIFGVLEADPYMFDFILNQFQAERVLSWLLDDRAFPRLVLEFSGGQNLSELQHGDVIDFDFDPNSQLDKAFLKLISSGVTLFRVIDIKYAEDGRWIIIGIAVTTSTSNSGIFTSTEDGYTQGANFYDDTLAIPIGDYNGSPVY